MNRCVILAGSPQTELPFVRQSVLPTDYLICADAGCSYALAAGLQPSLILGDFDSVACPKKPCAELLTYPSEKDETDTMLALIQGLKRGFRDFLILGGTGGRLDHTIANLHLLVYALEHDAHAILADSRNQVQVLRNGKLEIPRQESSYLSLFAWGGEVRGLTVRGVQYPLNHFTLDAYNPLGVSNQITEPFASVSVEEGTLLIFSSKDA